MDPGYLDTTPMRPPPPGQTSNFVDPVSRSFQLEIVITVTIVLVVLFVSSRIYTRLRITHSFGADDWLCIVATIFTLSYSALILKLLWKPGGGILGIHLWDVPLSHYIIYQKASLADAVLIRICNTLIKVAFFVFYFRLFHPIKHVRVMIWAGMAAVIVFCLAFVIVDLVACSPRPNEHGGWLDPSMLDRCNRIAPPLITGAAYFSVITDFYILFIPLHQVPTFGLSQKRKIGISFIFLTGLLACGAGLTNLVIRSNKKVFDTADFSWTIVPVYITSILEINVGLICLSMPVIFVLFVGRFTNLSNTLSSWVGERRARRHGSGESSAHLTPDHSVSPQLPSVLSPTPTLTGMRKFIRNLYRSGAQSSGHDTTLPTFDDLTTADFSYHAQLKTIRSSHTERSRGDNKHG
ncbi:hypothetical protein F4677DRAFT_418981 [Hypoxylon crocopeplum]|nr:hypothetical protein F4677DRAFT_418981 [Hypoxylon crocopeplum]